MIKRTLEPIVLEGLQDHLTVLLYGARQTGKTTLVKEIAKKFDNPLYLDCDLQEVREQLTNTGIESLKQTIGTADIVIVDEAQRVENIGLTAKIIHDNKLVKNLILTGSSSLELANKIKESLTGRTKECHLEPLSIIETSNNIIEAKQQLDHHLIYGGYPGLWNLGTKKAAERLTVLATDKLFKDSFAMDTIYDAETLLRLLQLLALQIGSEVSYNELSNKLNIAQQTVVRYIDLLEKAFIIYRVNQYRKNQRTEIGRLRKVYFYDLGIRNGLLLGSFTPMHLRNDSGALWENFVFNERRKLHVRNNERVNMFYWRSTRKQELDLVEETDTELAAFECKYGKTNARLPKEFIEMYGNQVLSMISQQNFYEFLK